MIHKTGQFMIKVFTSFLVVTLALGGCIYAQDTLKIGKTRVKILDDIPFYLNGTLINDDSTIFNSGNIYLKGNIINNHTSELFTQGEAGIVRFLGDTLQQVSGNPVFFNKIQLNKDSILLLNTNIRLSDSVILVKGNIDLNGNTLYLDNSSLALNGIITPESDVSRIYGSAGYVYTNMPLNDFLINGLNLGLLISGVSGGDIRVERYHIPELTVTDGSINKYFNLYPQNAGQSANAEFHYLDPIDLVNVNCTEADFKIWSSYCNGVYYENKYGVVDASGNFAHTTSSPIVIQNPTRLTVADEICDSPPVIYLGPDTIYICKGNIAVLDAGNTGSDFIWNTSEATQEISVSTSGKYSVMVTDQRGCFSTDSIVVMVDSLPVIDNIFVSVSPQCISETFTFSNASHINPLDSISGFLWEFGDGVTSSDSLAVHIYQGTGTYSAQLTVYSGDGCAVSETHNVTVLPLPNVSFSFSNACLDDTVNFLNTTPGGIFSSDWDLGNGIQSSAHDTICAYHTEGTYTVSLVVMNSFGCVDSVSQSIEIYAPGVAGFTTDDANVCLGASSVFHNNSTSPSGSLTYTWDFGNGLNSATANPIIAYSSAGTYIVTLIASTGMGCKDTVVHQVEIFSVPDAAFSFNEVCLGDTTYFTNLTTISPVETLDYYWETGDGANNTNENFGYLYDQQGSYNVALTATSTHGCFSSVNHQVNVHPNPAANFFCTAVCQCEASFFNNVSYPDDGSLSVLWDFGDGNSSFEQDPYHTYSADGSYMVTLSVETGFGCTDSIEKPVVVHPLPVVDLGDTIYHCDDSYILNADNPGDSYLWSNNAISQTITVVSDGIYSVTVTNSFGCEDNDNVMVYLNSPVIIGIDPVITACDSVILDAGYPGASYLWSTSEITRTITVTSGGTYSVTVTNQGCEGYGTSDVTINISPTVNLGPDQTHCYGTPVTLDAQNTGSGYEWSDGSVTQQIPVSQTGDYWVIVTDINGCTATDMVHVTFNDLPQYVLNDTTVCGSYTLNAGNPGSTYLWQDSSTDSIFYATSSGIYWVAVTSGYNCSITDTIDLIIHPLPVVELGSADTSICNGEVIDADAGPDGIIYLWSTGSDTQTETITSSGVFWVQLTNSYGCSSTDTLHVTVNPNPTVDLGGNLFLCSNQDALLDAGNSGIEYLWGCSYGYSWDESYIIVADSGRYWVDVWNDYGCRSSDTAMVQYSAQSLTAYFLAPTEAKVGDTLQFIEVSYPVPTSFYWDFKDGITSTETDPVHVYFIEGNYHVLLQVNNSQCSDTISKNIIIEGFNKYYHESQLQSEQHDTLIQILKSVIYPNPNDGEFNYELELNVKTEVALYLFDLNGRLIYTEHINNASTLLKHYQFRDLPQGLYIFKMMVSDQHRTYKIVKI